MKAKLDALSRHEK